MFFSFLFFAFAVAAPVTLRVDFNHPTPIANATTALGGAIDGHEKGFTQETFSPSSVKKMLQAGLHPLAYRLRTELGVEAWHWNPTGTWSDAKHHQGYWTSSITTDKPIQVSYGYRLPRRGDTLDEANNDDYSRLDDGNPKTFWKSNPYLTSHYTGESDAQHPQWVILDFGKPTLINAARLHWREPYAKKFKIQYANDGVIYFGNTKAWHDFPKGIFNDARGSSDLLDLGTPHHFFGKPIAARFVRILMNEGSGTAPSECTDPRDQMGYTLQEVEIGFLKNGVFQDQVTHCPNQHQTMMTVSSTDPWHRDSDLDEKTEQPGIDLVATSLLGNDQPILWSLPVFYDTPENATALVAYLKRQAYLKPHQRLELGEEPDGQHVDPKDFGALYCQVSKKVGALFLPNKSHHTCCTSSPKPIFPDSQPELGGPSFVTIDCQPQDTTYRFDHRRWLKPFFQELQRHHQEKDFQFLTFEWYPFDDLLLPAPELLDKQTGSLQRAMNLLRHGGIPQKMPMLITEYGYSVFSGEPEVRMEAALLNAEIVSDFLLAKGTTAYLYGYEPNTVESGINNSWGNLMMLLKHGASLTPLPTFYGAQIETSLIKNADTIFPVKSSQPHVRAYAFHSKKENSWSLLLINKSHSQQFVKLAPSLFEKSTVIEKTNYSPQCYQWCADGPNGFPSKNEPPQRKVILMGDAISVEPWSLTVVKKFLPSVENKMASENR